MSFLLGNCWLISSVLLSDTPQLLAAANKDVPAGQRQRGRHVFAQRVFRHLHSIPSFIHNVSDTSRIVIPF